MRETPRELLHICAVTTGEIQAGVEVTREQDPGRADEIEAWLDQLLDSYDVLPADGPVFREWARLMHRQSDTLIQDALIAAVARVHGLTVVTRNTRDFDQLRVQLLNPFEPAGQVP